MSEIFVENKIVKSKTEWKRFIESNSVKFINTEKENQEEIIKDFKVKIYAGVFKIGKRKFVKIVL
jgi:tyrosyl-tRNA synthetase